MQESRSGFLCARHSQKYLILRAYTKANVHTISSEVTLPEISLETMFSIDTAVHFARPLIISYLVCLVYVFVHVHSFPYLTWTSLDIGSMASPYLRLISMSGLPDKIPRSCGIQS